MSITKSISSSLSQKRVIVLGAGLVGSAIAIDLSKNYRVTSVDRAPKALKKLEKHREIETKCTDLSDPEKLNALVADFDLVIGAVPGHLGYQTMKTVICAGKNMVDISFMPEDFLTLDGLAKKYRATVVADCGVAPGLGNIILGYHNEKMDVSSYECLVGGLPVIREWPYEYKVVFSPVDVIEEYTRKARYIQNYEMITREALSEPELVHFDEIGTLESWNSDGLRSLLKTMKNIPDLIEKTLRYPGCIEYLRVLRYSGFFSYKEIEVNGIKIRPIDVTSKILFPIWQLKEGEEDFTIMRIIIEASQNGQKQNYTYTLLDRYDKNSQTISMARTTGYTCNAVASLILDGYNHPGVNAPEHIGASDENYNYILKYLEERDVKFTIRSK